jgi:hypothetical protein
MSAQLASGRMLAVAALGGLAGLGITGSAVPATHGTAGRTVRTAWFYGVSARSATDVWAVGGFGRVRGAAPLIEHWNGRTWKPMRAGLNNLGDIDDFSGVAAASAGSVWAAGGDFSQYAFPMVEHWAGRKWMWDFSVPSSGGGDTGDSWLNGVAAPSAKQAWAVGAIVPRQTVTAWILAWQGHGWRQVRSPSPAHSNDSELLAVAARSARDAWAVGYALTRQGHSARRWVTLTEHWNGTKWTTVPSPDPSSGGCGDDRLFGVTDSRAGTWAVGTACHAPLVLQLKDGRWRQLPTPPAGTPAGLASVTATSSTNAWAVGSAAGRTLILHWNGTTWALAKSPSPASATSAVLAGVSAVSRSVAFAVGQAHYPHHAIKIVIERWAGTKWELIAVPNPPERKGTGNI